MKYRAEIDGLRTIAVIPVILFHAGYEWFSGGFVGVDIFFVISGYLITSIILSEKEKGTFTLINFYERRARRILPVLFFVMLVCLPFAWFFLLPSDLKEFSKSLVTVSIFSSNFLFWQETGYWDSANELKPLLHTWSLAVEEQYYVLFPLLLMFMGRFRKRWILSVFLIIAMISLAIAEWGAYNKPIATFFLLPTRGWELAIGATLAFYFIYRKQTIRSLLSHNAIDEILGLVGLSMIAYSVFYFDESTPFPSFYTLVPTIGTGLIILFSSDRTLIGRFLSTKLFVGIGLISYSSYLWHQPLLVFARHMSLTTPNPFLTASLVLFILPLSFLSYRYIESPFRNRKIISRQSIFTLSIAGTAFFIIIGIIGIQTNGFENRTTNSNITLKDLDKNLEINHGLSDACENKFTLSKECKTSEFPEILVWGDSLAMHLVQGILASQPNAKLIQMTKSWCGPFFDIAPMRLPDYPIKWAEGCLEFNNKVLKWIETHDITYIILSSPFHQYLSKKSQVLNRNGDISKANFASITLEFEKTLNHIRNIGITPVVFSPPPTNGNNLGRCLARADFLGFDLDECNFNVSDITKSRLKAYKFLDNFSDNFRIIRLDKLICNKFECQTHIDKTFIFRDGWHFSQQGSAILGKKLDFYNLIINKQ